VLGELAALGSALIWAGTSLLFTAAGRVASPVATNAFKTVAATLLFAAVLWVRDGLPWDATLQGRDVLLLAGSGLLGLSLGDSLLFMGYQILGTRRAMLVTSLHPVVGALGAWALLGEVLGWQACLGMALALAGVGLVIGDRMGSLLPADRAHLRLGVLLCVGAAVGQAGGALLAKAALARADAFGATQVRVFAGALGLLLFSVLRGETGRWTAGLRRREVLWRVSVASVFGPFLAIWFMLFALKNASTGVVLTLLAMSPIWLLPLGWAFQGDRPTRREVAGAFAAVGGIAVLLMR
jgi:drug/metabolite transporter (DMT)-like permease